MKNSNNKTKIQNQFTGYLLQMIRHTKIDYIKQMERRKSYEFMQEAEETISVPFEEEFYKFLNQKAYSVRKDISRLKKYFDYLENESLIESLSSLTGIELKILIDKILLQKSFKEIGTDIKMKEKKVRNKYYYIIHKIRRNWRD